MRGGAEGQSAEGQRVKAERGVVAAVIGQRCCLCQTGDAGAGWETVGMAPVPANSRVLQNLSGTGKLGEDLRGGGKAPEEVLGKRHVCGVGSLTR